MWTGSLWYYRNPDDAPSIRKALTGVDCDSGCVDGKFIGDKTRNVSITANAVPYYKSGVVHIASP